MLFHLSCSDSGTNFADKDFSAIEDPQARWNAYGVKSYLIIQAQNCFCGYGGTLMKVTVINNHITSVVRLTNDQPIPVQNWSQFKTVDELFALVKSVKKDSVAYFRANYDPKYGYPSDFFVDPKSSVADEEYGYTSSVVIYY